MTKQSEKDANWAGKATAVVFLIAFIIWLIYKTVEAIIGFYHAHTNWFWFIVAVIIISPTCFVLRFKITETLKNIFNRNKPKPTDSSNNQE